MPVFLHFETPTPDTRKKGVMNVDINAYMENAGLPHFNFDLFNNVWESSQKIQDLVKKFDQDGIELNTQADMSSPGDEGDDASAEQDTVAQMAQPEAGSELGQDLQTGQPNVGPGSLPRGYPEDLP